MNRSALVRTRRESLTRHGPGTGSTLASSARRCGALYIYAASMGQIKWIRAPKQSDSQSLGMSASDGASEPSGTEAHYRPNRITEVRARAEVHSCSTFLNWVLGLDMIFLGDSFGKGTCPYFLYTSCIVVCIRGKCPDISSGCKITLLSKS